MNFSLGSIPVRIRPEFFIIPAIGLMSFGAQRGMLWVAIVFISVLGHELGHAMAMKKFGFAPSIELHGMGGWTLWPQNARPNEKQKLIVTLCGPGIEIIAGGAVWLAFSQVELPELARFAVTQFVWVNIVWGSLNLLPILPWDGGLVLDSTVALITGKPRRRIVGMVSMVLGAVALAVALLIYKQFMLGYLGAIGMWKGWQRWSGDEPAGIPQEAEEAWALSAKGQHAAADELLTKTVATTKDPLAKAHLLEVLAWVRLSANDPRGAENAIDQIDPAVAKVSPEIEARLAAHRQQPYRVVELLAPLALKQMLRPEAWPLLMSAYEETDKRDALISASLERVALSQPERVVAHAVAEKLFVSGHIEPALVLCRIAFEKSKEPVFAFNAACCLCRLGRVDEGLVALEQAVKAGYRGAEALEKDPDLAPLRELPGFAALREQVRVAKT